jgi:tRNA G18 (ribose-2'-O)-methylase SpoU
LIFRIYLLFDDCYLEFKPKVLLSQPMTRPGDYYVRHEAGSDRLSLEEARAVSRFPFYGVLDCLRSAHNVGSIFRTCDGVAAGGLLLCGYTPKPPHRHLAKTALGAVETVPWEAFDTVEDAIENLRSRQINVLALEKNETSVSLYDYPLEFPVALVCGNEAEGLTPEVCTLCDATVHLPMWGHKNSLNVSVAFGAAIYEVQRRFGEMRKNGTLS